MSGVISLNIEIETTARKIQKCQLHGELLPSCRYALLPGRVGEAERFAKSCGFAAGAQRSECGAQDVPGASDIFALRAVNDDKSVGTRCAHSRRSPFACVGLTRRTSAAYALASHHLPSEVAAFELPATPLRRARRPG